MFWLGDTSLNPSWPQCLLGCTFFLKQNWSDLGWPHVGACLARHFSEACPFPKAPACFKIAGAEHFSKCLRCTCSIYQLAPHSLQSFSLRAMASDFVNASFSKEAQISSTIWLCQSGHLAPDTSTISFNFPPFSVVPVK